MIQGKIATAEEAIRFYQVQLSRAEINLKNAQARKDARAVNSINRKIRIYKFTIDFLGR